MRRLLPYFLALASAVAAPAPDAASRGTALQRIIEEARVETLLEQSAKDVSERHYELALKRADEALTLAPGNPIALNTRGAALTELKRFDEAKKALDQALAASPDAFAPQFNQGEILSLQKKYLEAGEHFSNLQLRFGGIPILKFKLYLCYTLAGQKDLAAETLGQLRYPEDGAAWYFAYAVDRLKSGQTAEAKKLITAAEAIHTDEAGTYRDSLVETGLLK